MNVDALTDSATQRALHVPWLRAELEPAGEYGRRTFEAWMPFAPGQESFARAQIARIAELAQTLDSSRVDALREAMRGAPDATAAIARAAMGELLADAQLLEIQRVLDAATRAGGLLAQPDGALRASMEELAALTASLERGRRGSFGFYLADSYDSSLAAARAIADEAQAQYDAARAELSDRVARSLGRDDIATDEFILMRAELHAPLPPGVRVIREAPTYLLCELEHDEAALVALERRDRADAAVAASEESARANLCAIVRSHVRALDRLLAHLGRLDLELAQVRFAQRFACVTPEIVDRAVVAFSGARFLPLDVQLEREGRIYEPIALELDGVAVLTGPNMGGKSVALRTAGFIALLAAFGLPVPARDARVGLFSDVAWLGIGSAEGGGLLSSFAQEVVRLRDLLARPAQRMLLLVDEFARTTTPREGKALLVALVRALRERERIAFIATHLAGISEAGGVRHFAVRGLRDIPATPPSGDLAEALAALAASMDYSIDEVTGEGERPADAIALAQLLGLDAALIAEARRALDGER